MIEWILSSCALIIAILLIRLAFKGKISPRLQYVLWGLVLLRLLVPVSFFHSDISSGQLVEQVKRQPAVQSVAADLSQPSYTYEQAHAQAEKEFPQTTVDLEQRTQEILEQSAPVFILNTAIRWIWYAGMLVTTLCLLLSNLRFAWNLKKNRSALTVEGSSLKVYTCEGLDTPCLFGIIRPAIYLTPEEADDEVRRGHIIAHETTHFHHLDHIWSILRCICLVLHWYNPLVWLAANLSRRDAELACDEATLLKIGEDQRVSYGRTLIETTCAKSSTAGLFSTATTMTSNKTAIKERVTMIAKKPRMTIFTLIAVLLIAATVVGCTYSGIGDAAGEFSLEKGHKIKNAIWEHFPEDTARVICTVPWCIEGYETGIPYLGYESGYDFFRVGTYFNPNKEASVEIGGILFDGTWDVDFLAHKDGQIYQVSNLYEEGKISLDVIASIKEAYDEWYQKRISMTSKDVSDEDMRWLAEMEANGWEYTGGK